MYQNSNNRIKLWNTNEKFGKCFLPKSYFIFIIRVFSERSNVYGKGKLKMNMDIIFALEKIMDISLILYLNSWLSGAISQFLITTEICSWYLQKFQGVESLKFEYITLLHDPCFVFKPIYYSRLIKSILL